MAKLAFISVNDVSAESLRLMSSSLQRKGHEVNLIFVKKYHIGLPAEKGDWIGVGEDGKEFRYGAGNHVSEKEMNLLLGLLEEINPDAIGCSVTGPLKMRTAEICRMIKDKFDVPIIWGGLEPTLDPEECLKFCDYACIGEGDQAILEVADRIDEKKPLVQVNNLAFMRDHKIVRNPLNKLVQDLDDLPFKDISPHHKYLIEDDSVIRDFDEINYSGKRVYFIHSARGCPFQCSYCGEDCLKRMYSHEKFLRRRSVESVIKELKHALQKIPYEEVQFWDEVFAIDRKWLIEFSEQYKKEINKPFFCYIIPETKTDNLELLHESGLARTCLGLQSGSKRINKDVFRRPWNEEAFLKTARRLKELHINYYVDTITYNPFENKEDLEETLRILREIPKPFELCVNKLYVMKNSEIEKMISSSKATISRKKRQMFDFYARLFWLTNTSEEHLRMIPFVKAVRLFRAFPTAFNPLVLKNLYKRFMRRK
ncbi:B12-binding domain-containing radical SAM protein [Candidatus Woesearchaeota archaeon]|nr:B12-binding domain-containing radical SAM protein [Candidatus Woesearchaeota archaeon]